MKVIGLTGGVGSGKSAVACMLEGLGALVMDADQFAKDLTQPGGPVLKKIIQHFGAGFLCPDKSLNRKALAQLVFNDPVSLQALNQIIHPEVRKLQQKTALQWQAQHPKKLQFYNVPLLFEAGLEKKLHPIVVVWAPTKHCLNRIRQSRGWSFKESRARMRVQIPIRQKMLQANFCISNHKSLKHTFRQVKTIYFELQRRHLQN